jgi:glycerophosphoryl diester phosphodiesterase
MKWNCRKFLLVSLGFLATAHCALAQEAGPLVLAHRGGAQEYEENTMDAFRSCYENGIRAFEIDIRMTRDGVLVILHDDSLDRTYNSSGPVEDKLAAEVEDVVSKKGQRFLFLDEFLDYFADKPGVYIELEMKVSNKSLYSDERIRQYCRTLYKAVEAKKPETSVYVYTSFDERPLKEIRSLDAKVPTSFITGKPLTAEIIEKAKSLKTTAICCQLNGASRTMVKEAQKQGFKVTCWTGRSAEDYLLCLGLGVDVHCTDIPMAVLKVKEKLR